LTSCAGELNLTEVRLDVNAPQFHEGYFALWSLPGGEVEEAKLWRTEIPLTAGGLVIGRVHISGTEAGSGFWDKIAVVAKILACFIPPLPAAGHVGANTAPNASPPGPGQRRPVGRPGAILSGVDGAT
jgi:hypothetical protein